MDITMPATTPCLGMGLPRDGRGLTEGEADPEVLTLHSCTRVLAEGL